jgi:Cu2+-exporting ATPase
MGTGTDVAIESAKITLVKAIYKGIAKNLSHAVMRNIKQNLFFAFSIMSEFPLPLAFCIHFGVLLSPMIATLAMSFSSVS